MSTTKGLILGSPEAESEKDLSLSFFEDYMNISPAIERGKFIITGRKGAGKSAYAVWLMEQMTQNQFIHCEMIKKGDVMIESLIHSIGTDNIKQVLIFEWIILVKLVKMIIGLPEGRYHKYAKALQEFYVKNAGYVDIDSPKILETLLTKNGNINPLRSAFLQLSRGVSVKTQKADFYEMVVPLRTIVSETLQMDVYKNHKFYVLFDDLDVKFKLDNSQDKETILSLIRVAKQYNTELLRHTNARILIFLRDDISDKLDGVDCDKSKLFGSYEHCINWYEHDIAIQDETQTLLRKFINHRIAVAFEKNKLKYDKSDPWKSLVEESSYKHYTTCFKYILDHTFYLPRDLVNIFKSIGDKNYSLPLSEDIVYQLLKNFAIDKRQEIYDELVATWNKTYTDNMFRFLGEVRKLIHGDENVPYNQIIRLMTAANLQPDDFQILIEYNLLVPVDYNGKQYFTYREQPLVRDYSQYNYRLPKIIALYFKN